MQDELEQNNKTDDQDNLRSQEEDEIDLAQLASVELAQEEEEMLEQVSSDLGFKVAIESLLAGLDGMEQSEIQSRILLLLGKFFRGRVKDPKMLKGMLKDDEIIKNNIKSLSLYLLHKNQPQEARQANRGIAPAKDKYEYMGRSARDNLRKIIQRFAVYELYKFITPRRIAGETKKQNFVHNMIVGGIERASHFQGGSELEVKSYGKKFVQKLETMHKQFVRSGGRGIM